MSTKIKLKGRSAELKWTNRAKYRLGTLQRVPDFDVPDQVFSAICAWVWALLPKELARRYPAPEDIADDIDIEEIEQYVEAINAAVAPETEDEEEVDEEEKNSSTDCAQKSVSQSE